MTNLKLKELREKEGKTQQDIANLFKIPRQNYARWELNKNQPNIDMLIKIADYYGVSLDYLCDHRTQNQIEIGYLTDIQKQAILALKQLNESNLAEAYGYINGLLAGQ